MIAAHQAGIPVFVTGGVGGVHRGAETSKSHLVDSEMIWDILKFQNFQYYPAGCAIPKYGTDF